MVSAALGTLTAVADYVVHPGHFGPAVMEALVTGLIAAALSFSLGMLKRSVSRRFRRAPAPAVAPGAGLPAGRPGAGDLGS